MTAPIAGEGDLPGDDDNQGTSTTAPSGGHLFSLRAKVFDADDLRRAHTRIAHEIVERNHGATDIVLIGLYTRGVAVAHRLAEAIERFEGVAVPGGAIDVAFYPDDIGLRRTPPPAPTEGPAAGTPPAPGPGTDRLFHVPTARAPPPAITSPSPPPAVP